jgi:hypothetical protein
MALSILGTVNSMNSGGQVPQTQAQQSTGGWGDAIVNGIGAYGQYQQNQNNQKSPGQAGSAAVAGLNNGINAVNNIYGQTSGLTVPTIQAGAGASNQMMANTAPYVNAGHSQIGTLQGIQSGGLDVNKYLDPSMAFTMKQGMNAIQGSAAARGGVLSGAGLKDIASYASGLASQNYQNATQNALAARGQDIGIGNTLYQGGLSANNQLAPIIQAGSNALGDQTNNGIATGGQLAQLNQNIGQTNANAITQGNAAGAGNNVNNYLGAANAANGVWNAFSGGSGSLGSNLSDLGSTISDWFSDMNTKEDIKPMSSKDVNDSLNGMHAKTYEYNEQAQAMGAPSGRQSGIIAQDVMKTPAKDMVNNTSPMTINGAKAGSFALAAVAELNKRMNALEKSRG